MKLIMFVIVLIEDVIVSQFHVPDPQKTLQTLVTSTITQATSWNLKQTG